MQYEGYLKNFKEFVKKTTFLQRLGGGILLFLVIGIGVYFYNPQEKLLEMRNSQRRSDVVNILNAVYQFGVDNDNALSTLIPAEPGMICRSGATSCDGLVNISQIIAVEKRLLSKMPVDPKEKNSNSSGYQISHLANGRISVSAPLAENGVIINQSK